MAKMNPDEYEIDEAQWDDFRSSVISQVEGMLDSLYEVAKADCSILASFEALGSLEGNSQVHQRTVVGQTPIDVDPNAPDPDQP